jgi:hypothetical protein
LFKDRAGSLQEEERRKLLYAIYIEETEAE